MDLQCPEHINHVNIVDITCSGCCYNYGVSPFFDNLMHGTSNLLCGLSFEIWKLFVVDKSITLLLAHVHRVMN